MSLDTTSTVTTFLQAAKAALPDRLAQWSRQVAGAALATGVDPWLLCAVVDRESLGGNALTPIGPAGKGDQGHGRGLMQIDDRSHQDFLHADFDGNEAQPLWTMPSFNVLYGAELLAKNMRAFNGDSSAALAAYNAGRGRVKRVLDALGPGVDEATKRAALDRITAGGSYVTNVLARFRNFKAAIPPPGQ